MFLYGDLLQLSGLKAVSVWVYIYIIDASLGQCY